MATSPIQKILVTGADGYIGSVLVPYLASRHYDVTGLDTGFYNSASLYHDGVPVHHTLSKDIRHLTAKDFEGFDAVVHLAELSNDPTGELAPDITHAINHRGSVHIADCAKKAGVRRFVYTSSCSVYGVAEGSDVTEESATNPQTAYAVCKTLVERDVKKMASDRFSPTFLRNATAYGASPHMRFDLVLNNLSGLAWTTQTIQMVSDGTPWRPLVHILDISQAVACVLEAPTETAHNEIFNVGDSAQNYQVKHIAQIVGAVFPGCRVSFGTQGADNRSYRVSFEKIHRALPNFRCVWNAQSGARQLFKLFSAIAMPEETFLFRSYTRLKQLKFLLETRQINNEFFWNRSPVSLVPEPS